MYLLNMRIVIVLCGFILLAPPSHAVAQERQCYCKNTNAITVVDGALAEAPPANMDNVNIEALEYINKIRSDRGLDLVAVDADLVEVAVRHSQWLTDNDKDTEHYQELQWAAEKGFPASHAGVYSATNLTVKEVVDAWLNSESGHAALIVSPGNIAFGLGNVTNDWTIVVSTAPKI